MLLKIDCREKKIIEELKRQNIKFIEEQLDLGDFIIYDNTGIKILFERKTINDLASSIIDGRYKEQSCRLNSFNIHNHNIIYLIEGDLNNISKFTKINKETLSSAMITLQYFKGFTVLKSNDIKDSCSILLRYLTKLNKENKPSFYDLIPNKENIDTLGKDDYSSIIKNKKKDNITKDNINMIMLQQIPDISFKTASVIIDKYKTIVDLVHNLQIDNDCLNNLKLVNNGKERKISKKCIENIKKFLLNE